MPMQMPLTSYRGPSSSGDYSKSETYDHSGLDDHIKRQDQIAGLRDAKFQSLYGGDVAGGVTAGNKIRDLLKAVHVYAPAATERDPGQLTNPLVRLASKSVNSSSSNHGEQFEWAPTQKDVGMPPPAILQPPVNMVDAPAPPPVLRNPMNPGMPDDRRRGGPMQA